MRVVIVGQGYVGLPLAVAAAQAGHHVVGFDKSKSVVDGLNAGISHIDDVSASDLQALVTAGSFAATTDPDAIAGVDVVVICVPTPYHNDAPDLSHVEAAASDVAVHLTEGTLVILESTTYPGTTEDLLRPILEQGSGLTAGEGFHLVFSPERIDPGNQHYGIHNTPKIVGGVTARGAELAEAFYGSFVEHVVRVSTPGAAEMAKVLENTFRHINIALVNELAILCRDLDIDVWEVIDAAASKPFGFMPFYPGPGVGGHCIPVDPMYLSWRVRQLGLSAKFIDLARDVNDAMPIYCVARIQDLLNDREQALKGSDILLVGVAYKPNIADMRESPALPIIELLRRRGANVRYHDPHVQQVLLRDGTKLHSVPLDDALDVADCVVVITPHASLDLERVAARARLVFDTRNAVPRAENVHRL